MSTPPPHSANDRDTDRQSATTARNIALLAGDGIGPELMDAVRPLLVEAFPNWSLHDAAIGWSCWCAQGNAVPPHTWEVLDQCDAALFAAITSKPVAEAERELTPALQGTGARYVSPILQLRKRLDLYANIRPVGNFVVVRENTEGLYSHDFRLDYLAQRNEASDLWERVREDTTVRATVGQHSPEPHANGAYASDSYPCAEDLSHIAVSLRVTTAFGWRRILRTAAKLAVDRASRRNATSASSQPRVTIADKPNVLRESGAVIAAAVDSVAAQFPQVEFDIANADIVAMHMLTDPERFDVIVAENLIGDILSDLGAGLIGGIGLPASANLGDNFAVFEPVHGSAPDIAGQGIANPTALLLSAAMCADYVGDDGTKLRDSVHAAMRTHPTRDLGGTATTTQFVAAVREHLFR